MYAALTMHETEKTQADSLPPYVLITPACNEEAYIENTIQSVIAQTAPPLQWVIVDDGSTDATGDIAGRYAAQHHHIKVVSRPPNRDRNFGSKVRALTAGAQGPCAGTLIHTSVLNGSSHGGTPHGRRATADRMRRASRKFR